MTSIFTAGDSAAAPRATLRAEALTKPYYTDEMEVRALRGVDFELYESEFAVLVGSSGSGKSTLLNILGGLDVQSSERVLFEDVDSIAVTLTRPDGVRTPLDVPEPVYHVRFRDFAFLLDGPPHAGTVPPSP